jgi:RNA-directed DNA polymerase
LHGGTGDLTRFVEKYKKKVDKYLHSPLECPVIVLVDNDKGADGLFKLIASMFKVTITLTTTEDFYPITKNLYVVKTPELGASSMSCIENLFDPSALTVLVEGKSFNMNKAHESDTEYGKTVFAHKVVRKNIQTLDFSGFYPLLTRVIGVINHHAQSAPRPHF